MCCVGAWYSWLNTQRSGRSGLGRIDHIRMGNHTLIHGISKLFCLPDSTLLDSPSKMSSSRYPSIILPHHVRPPSLLPPLLYTLQVSFCIGCCLCFYFLPLPLPLPMPLPLPKTKAAFRLSPLFLSSVTLHRHCGCKGRSCDVMTHP